MKNRRHVLANYLQSPSHYIRVNLIGCGGSGSQMLTALARIHTSLVKMGRMGLYVHAWDGDEVSEANIGRQVFYQPDLGGNKAQVLITRINRCFGLQWEAIPHNYNYPDMRNKYSHAANITITCVDNVKTRIDIGRNYHKKNSHPNIDDIYKEFYWLDMGNTKDTGQIVLGTFTPVTQPKNTKSITYTPTLPKITDLYDLSEIKEEGTGPSCSTMEALMKQDLFINSMMANYAGALLWRLLHDMFIDYHGIYVNLSNFTTAPISI
ncbi:MAG TPA: PRTRC system ThiF family protein [Candidatus Cloacimonadota bacterium]|nr:PRTRC system ThiF family protein [Candidatus Cloacimonadota bacterium]